MPDLFYIISKWWKRMLALTAAALLVAAIALMLVPKQYLSTTTALPANSLATDKSSIFSNGIQELYSSLGSAGELDRFLGTAQLDTAYIAVANAHQLSQHYKVNQDAHAGYNAARQLKKNTRIERTEYGELQLKVWDEDRDKGAALANALMQEIQLLHQQLQSQSNALILQKLKEAQARLQPTTEKDSLLRVNMQYKSAAQEAQLENLVAQYSLMVHTNPPALLIVEKARPALTHDKPYMWPTLLLTFFAALLFSFLMALLVEKRTAPNV